MEEPKRTAVAVVILMVLFLGILGIVLFLFSKKQLISPIPDEGAIKIIFITPTPEIVASPTPTPAPSATPKKTSAVKTPTPTQSGPTRTPTKIVPTKSAATPTQTPEP